MGSFLQDVRYGLRVLFRAPVVAAVAVASLAVGIAANGTVFSIYESFLHTDFGYERQDDLVMLFLDRSESHPDDLLAQEYRYVQPEDVTSTLRRSAADPAYRAGALNEVRRKLEEDPQSLLARALLELLSELSS